MASRASRYSGFASFGDNKGCVLLEVADTPELKTRGLMGRLILPWCCGMIFTGLDGGSFWMKGCKIPLDIVFLNSDNTISRKYSMQADGGVKRYLYGDESTAIELPYGFCKLHNIKVGDICDWRVW